MRPAGLPDRMPRDEAGIKALTKAIRCTKKDLMVLDPKNDPFNVDTPTKQAKAQWFRDLWTRFGYTNGIHSRRVHYHAVTAGDVLMPDGAPYVNTEGCWDCLAESAVHARDLGAIDPALFTDRRNATSRLFTWPRGMPPEPDWQVYISDRPLSDMSSWRLPLGWRLPEIDPSDLVAYQFPTGRIGVDGYDYDHDDQPYLIELWCEKSTMDDVLVPLSRYLGANYTPGTGFTSRTRIVEMLHRGRDHGKPVKVFVVSDYDPAGVKMPSAIARVIEFYRDQFAPGVRFSLHHIGMTRDWAERYDLPRSPIKDEDLRKGNFEALHGEGCVELDALEALHPGALHREMRAALVEHLDLELPRRLETTERVALADANEQWRHATGPIREELEQVRGQVNGIAERYRDRLTSLADELATEIDPHRDRLAELWQRLRDLAEDDELIELPDRPEPLTIGGDQPGWLYDSDRHWWDQLRRYRAESTRARGGHDA